MLYIIIGIIVWLLLGFCAYLVGAKVTYTTYFSWFEFIFMICLGLLGFVIIIIGVGLDKFQEFMEDLLKRLNK